MKIDIVVTRHAGLVEHLYIIGLTDDKTKVLEHATIEDITGKVVCGVLPHSLSCLTRTFVEVPMNVPQELRGVELNLEQVQTYAGQPVAYVVNRRDL